MELTLSDGPTLELAEITLFRTLGRPVEWRFTAEVRRDARGGEEVSGIASALINAPVKVVASAPEADLGAAGPEATVVGARWKVGLETSAVDFLEIDAQGTWPSPAPDPFVPRRRVHRVRTMRELIERFSNVCKPINGVLNELQKISFPDKDRTSIVQDGVSDWLFLGHIFDQCRLLRPGVVPWLPLTMVGGVDEQQGTAGHWIVTPGVRAAYDDWNDIEERTVAFVDGRHQDGFPRWEFGYLADESRVPDFPHSAYPAVIHWRQSRHFETGRWREWRTRDLPRFTKDGAMVWKIEDRLYRKGQPTVLWDTRLFSVPPQASIGSPIPAVRFRPWLGLGEVQETSSKGPWIKVRLSGFEEDQDVADIRLTTPFSGHDGAKGLHFVPAVGTEVKVGWNGRFDSSILLIGNTRLTEADFESPSIFLEDDYTSQFADIRVRSVGQTTVDSDLSMRINQETYVSSAQQLQVKADGADLRMAGGIVYTGR